MTFEKTTLPNGLTIATDHVPGSKGVAVRLILRSGSRHEDVPGTAHFLEHLVASSLTPEGYETYDFIRSIADSTNLYTGKETIEIKFNTLPQFVPAIMSALGRALSNPVWTDEIRERERGRIAQEFHERDNEPGARSLARFWEYAVAGHPFAQRIIGTPESIAAITQADLEHYKDHHVCGQRMAVFISGAMTHEKSLQACTGALEHIPEGTPIPVQEAPKFLPPRTVYVADERPEQVTTLVLPFSQAARENLSRPPVSALCHLYVQYLNRVISSRALNYSGAICEYVQFSDVAYPAVQFNTMPDSAGNMVALAHGCFMKPEYWLTQKKFDAMKMGWQMADAFVANDPRNRVEFMAACFQRTGLIVPFEDIDREFESLNFEDVLEVYQHLDLENFFIQSQGPSNHLPSPQDLRDEAAEEMAAQQGSQSPAPMATIG